MHSTETINQFLNLRAQGRSFARIADHLHVSKPTLLDWNHKYQSKIEAIKANQEHSVHEKQASQQRELQELTAFHNALRREFISRTLKNFSDDEIQTLTREIEQQIKKLNGKELVRPGPAQSNRVQPNPTTPPPPGKEIGKETVNFLPIFDHQ